MKRRDEISVGILVTVAVIVLLGGVLWLARGGLSSGYPLYTRFAWGQNLKQGQPVLLAGVDVGYVDDVQLMPDGYLDVTLRIDRQYSVPKSARARVHQVSFFGDMAVAITPRLGSNLSVAFAPGDTIPAGPPEASVTEIMTTADSVGSSLNRIVRALQAQVVDAGALRDLRRTIASTADLTSQLQKTIAEQNDHLTATLASYRHVADAIDTVAVDSAVVGMRQTTQYASRAAAKLDTSATRLNDILARLNDGQGTAGKFLTDTLLYRNLRDATASLDSLLTDIKQHPGRYVNIRIF